MLLLDPVDHSKRLILLFIDWLKPEKVYSLPFEYGESSTKNEIIPLVWTYRHGFASGRIDWCCVCMTVLPI